MIYIQSIIIILSFLFMSLTFACGVGSADGAQNCDSQPTEGVSIGTSMLGVGAAKALGQATGNSYVQGAVSSGTGAYAMKMAAAAGWWSGTGPIWVMTATSEFHSAYSSFTNGRKAKKISKQVTDDGLGIECPNGDCTNANGSNEDLSDPASIMRTDEEFASFVQSSRLGDVYGDVKNPKTALEKLGQMGYSLNSDGSLSTPDGGKYTKDDFNKALNDSPALAGEINKAKKMAAAMRAKGKKYLKLVQRYRGQSAGGFANKMRGQNLKNRGRQAFNGFNFGSKGRPRKPASAYGPISYVKGDPIGAVGDNVFHIIERAYDKMVVDKSLKQPK